MAAGPPHKLTVCMIDLPAPEGADLYEKYDFRVQTTIWNGGALPLDVTDADVVFINATYKDVVARSVHHDERHKFERLLLNGGLVFIFVGHNCESFHLENLVGSTCGFGTTLSPAPNCRRSRDSELDTIISRFGHQILSARPLFLPPDLHFPFLLNANGTTVGTIANRGKGKLIYLPDFGESDSEVAAAILEDVVPKLGPYLVYQDKSDWIRQSQYLMPETLALKEKLETERTNYAQLERLLSQQFEKAFASDLDPWATLLTETGDCLKVAVKKTLELFGWKVVDVDLHWLSQRISRPKEEDLWVKEGSIPDPKDLGVILVEVKSSEKGPATESHYSQLIKYMNRRKAECGNPTLRGMLIINHSYLTAAAQRAAAFAPALHSDAIRDGVTLASTWDIFRLGQRMRGGQATAEEIRNLLKSDGHVKV